MVGSLDDDLLSETDLSTGLIVDAITGLEIETIAFDLGEALANRGAADLLLQARRVLIFALPYQMYVIKRWSMRPPKFKQRRRA